MIECTKPIRWTTFRAWNRTLVSLAPLWLVSIAIMAEGFPTPPVPIELALAVFVLAILVSLELLWKRWMTVELVLYSFLPLYGLFVFDEISTVYKTPFIVLCALLLSAGVIAYQRSGLNRLMRGLVLLVAAGVTLVLAWHATFNFWQMVSDLGYSNCFPDASDCAPLTSGQAAPWWALFFSW